MTPLFIAGTSHPALAASLAKSMGIPLGEVTLFNFPDGETGVEITTCVRGRTVFVLQTCVGRPNDFLFELALILDALKRGGGRKVDCCTSLLSLLPPGPG